MICQKFEALSHYEKVQFLGKLTHASQSDDVLFEIANEIIRQGEIRGLFEKVSFASFQEHTFDMRESDIVIKTQTDEHPFKIPPPDKDITD